MSLNRYVLVANVTVPAGTLAAPVAGEPSTGGVAGYGSSATTGGPLFATTFLKGTPLILDTGSALYGALNGAGALRAFTDGQDTVGHAAIGN
jgi:hypothetical protein